MRLTENAERRPKVCIVSGRGEGPFIDFQTTLEPDPQPKELYIHKLLVEEAAERFCGMVPQRRVKQLEDELAELGERLEQTKDIAELTQKLEEAIA